MHENIKVKALLCGVWVLFREIVEPNQKSDSGGAESKGNKNNMCTVF